MSIPHREYSAHYRRGCTPRRSERYSALRDFREAERLANAQRALAVLESIGFYPEDRSLALSKLGLSPDGRVTCNGYTLNLTRKRAWDRLKKSASVVRWH